jgi:hypothetical protein
MASNTFANLKGLKETATATGRAKRGKSSDPKYAQTSVYLQRETIKKAQVRLIEEDFDFSDLVEKLLRDWVEKK